MKSFGKSFGFVLLLAGGAVLPQAVQAQKWEVGAGAGGSFFTSTAVKNAVTSGDVGFANAVNASFWLGNNSNRLIGGELRYDYENTNLQVTSSASKATFGGDTHAVHYDFVLNFNPRESRVRPFVSGGGGVKLYRGTGKETAYQPLSNLALLTKTSEVKALISVGAGIKFAITPALQLRVEARDNMTPFPNTVIAPAQNTKIGGWVQDFMIMVGLSLIF